MAFHRYYFDLGGVRGRHQTTMCNPRVRLMGDVAVVAYMRLVQRIGPDGNPVTMGNAETRVWQRIDGRWRHVHFHRSMLIPMSN
jgi:calcium/calmodulin-dependent protein kinase (CaM kinase) II